MTHHDRLTARDGALLVVDVQDRLLAAIPNASQIVHNTSRLVRGAQLLGIPTFATEQYPQGLGPTHADLADLLPDRCSKMSFSCCGDWNLVEKLYARSLRHVTLAGVEAHVCVAQTALDLLRMGLRVQVAVDAAGARHEIDRDVAFRRLENAGVVLSTTEAILFEWAETADHPKFKALSALVKEQVASV